MNFGRIGRDTSREFRFAAVSLRPEGGLDADPADTTLRDAAVDVLTAFGPGVVALTGVLHPDPQKVQGYFHEIANTLGMTGMLGPCVSPQAAVGSYTAILVNTLAGWEIRGQLPAQAPVAPGGRPWCMAKLAAPPAGQPLHFYAAHLDAYSRVKRLEQAQQLVGPIVEQRQTAIVAGRFNSYPRDGIDHTSTELAGLPAHLQHSRTQRTENGELQPDYRVDDTFTRAGLADIAAKLPAHRRQPGELAATGQGGARVDRFHATRHLDAAWYWQIDIGGPNKLIACTIDTSQLS